MTFLRASPAVVLACAQLAASLPTCNNVHDQLGLVQSHLDISRAGHVLQANAWQAVSKVKSAAQAPRAQELLQVAFNVVNVTAAQDFDPFVLHGPDPTVLGSDDRVEYIWKHDVFPGQGHTWRNDGDEGVNFFTAAPARDWVILAVASAVLCFLDVVLLQRFPDTFRVHICCIFFWIAVAVGYDMIVWNRMGKQKAIEWISGYVLEWMLSMDNLFVFHLIFKTYKTPANQIHKAVFVGVIGAVVMRLVFFMVVSTLLRLSRWIRFPFGILLIYSGVQAARGDDDEEDVQDTMMIRGLKWCLGRRFTGSYDEEGHAMFVWDGEQGLQVTLLLMVIFCLEATDILFAVDSVSAKVAQIPDQYVAFSSSVIAMYGLRAMFFVVEDLVEAFDLLQYGLCLILVFIGLELMFARYLHLASSTVCIMILSVFIICIVGSQVKKKFAKSDVDAKSVQSDIKSEKSDIKSEKSGDKLEETYEVK